LRVNDIAGRLSERGGELLTRRHVEHDSHAFSVATARIRTDLLRVRLRLASAKMGGAAARPVDLDDLGRVAEKYRPRRTDTED
jgi:hypothetical protein